MRILVVGARGYVGSRLVPLLAARGHELILMSRDARPLAARFAHATDQFGGQGIEPWFEVRANVDSTHSLTNLAPGAGTRTAQ